MVEVVGLFSVAFYDPNVHLLRYTHPPSLQRTA